MTDEKYVYTQDVRDKKKTARSARNRRTHNGKGGAVKFPSDYLSKKELKAMNGEVKSYRMNDPMTYSEFKSMPDDLKINYIKLIRQRFNASDSQIAKMMGVEQTTFSGLVRRLGIGLGRGSKRQKKWDKEGFAAWCNGETINKATDVIEQPEPILQTTENTVDEVEYGNIIPTSGTMTFAGNVDAAFKTVSQILCGANVHISIRWELCEEGLAVSDG